jgi:type II secretory pathway pseudopilin PulG
MRRYSQEHGFTLVELMLVCTLSLIIFGATLTAWTSVFHSNRILERQQDNVQSARVAIDRATRQLRNLANPTVNAITTIDRATDYDFIFQTSDPSKTWVRYCMQTSGGSTSVDSATLWEHESKTAITASMRSSCPSADPSWTTTRAVVANVTNQAGGIDRNVFTYECAIGAPAGCPASPAEYSRITQVGLNLWVDADRTDRASELNVATSVFLRNQNEAPTAVIGDPQRLATRTALLSGSGSSDPESRTLEYFWFEDSPPTASQIAATPCTAPFADAKWQGVTYRKRWDSTVPTSIVANKSFYLLVRDPGCLTSLSTVKLVQVYP